MAKHTYYFKHDFNAHNDEKIVDLLMTHGHEGYGIFWHLIELLASADEYQLESNYKRLSFSMQCNSEILKSVVEDFGLFSIEDNSFWSESLADRMKRLDEIKAIRAENGRKGGKAKANAKQMQSKREANAKQNEAEERRGEERIVKKSKEELFKARELAFYEELKNYLNEYPKEMIRKFYDYWREPNKSMSKMKWESEKTWSLPLRLSRWAGNNFDSKSNNQTFQKTIDNTPEYKPEQSEVNKVILKHSGQSKSAEDLEKEYQNMKRITKQ